MSYKKSSYKVLERSDDGPVKREVSGVVIEGVLGVHKGEAKCVWKVTHLKSGMRVCILDSQETAVAFAKHLVRLTGKTYWEELLLRGSDPLPEVFQSLPTTTWLNMQQLVQYLLRFYRAGRDRFMLESASYAMMQEELAELDKRLAAARGTAASERVTAKKARAERQAAL